MGCKDVRCFIIFYENGCFLLFFKDKFKQHISLNKKNKIKINYIHVGSTKELFLVFLYGNKVDNLVFYPLMRVHFLKKLSMFLNFSVFLFFFFFKFFLKKQALLLFFFFLLYMEGKANYSFSRLYCISTRREICCIVKQIVVVFFVIMRGFVIHIVFWSVCV